MRNVFPIVALSASLVAAPLRADVTFFSWAQGGGSPASKPIAPLDTHYCVLNRVTGSFKGTGEQVGVWHDANYWYLGGKSQQAGVSAYARCFERSQFASEGPAAKVVRWASDDLRVFRSAGGCHTGSKLAWWGDAATAVNRISGAFRGNGERVRIAQATSGKVPSQLIASTCQGAIDATAHSFFVGVPQSGSLVRFVGPGDKIALGGSGDYYSKANGTVQLARVTEAMCFFTSITGQFNGGGESVWIHTQGDRWVLHAQHKSGTGVAAVARCMAFAQN